MDMLIFIDESGYPHPNDGTKCPVLLGVCIYENDIRPLTNAVYKLKNTIYGKQDEIKATNVIKRQTIAKNRTKNKQYVDGLMKIVVEHNIAVFAIIMDKPSEIPELAEGVLPKQYHLLMKKIEYFCERKDIEKAIFVFDETDEGNDLKIANSFMHFLFKSALGKRFNRILETPLFVSSKVTPSIQIADIFAGIVRHYYENNLDTKQPADDYERWLCSLFHCMYLKTDDGVQPGTEFFEYGFQRVRNLNYIKKNKPY